MYTIKRTIRCFTGPIMLVMLLVLTTSAQDKPDTTKAGHKIHQMNHSMMDSTHHSKMMQHKIMDSTKTMNRMSSIIREEPIDLEAIDANGDGKVFQDQMDWNVISDEAGECPMCGMKLKEVTINEAKAKLIENGFEVK